MARLFRVIELTSISAGGGQKTVVSTHTPATQSAADIQTAYEAAATAATGNPRRTITTHDE